ncbi:MAG: nickel pincer cofactor biosynthesis protein LarC [Dethiobacteria bacterium]|jgi:uncharacterized protein (TIGR00299 family) protein
MNVLYLECPAGAAGDMLLAALLDCGLSVEELQEKLSLLPLEGYTLQTSRTHKKGLHALQVKVDVRQKQPFRHLPAIREIIEKSALSTTVKEKSLAVFQALAQAEARVHGLPLEKVHFHEIGAIDAIIDIVGSMLALEMLGVEKIWASPLPLGRGWINISHGWIPLPAPATMEIIKKYRIPCYGLPFKGETVTPTGAAILSIICSRFAPLPPMVIQSIGYGAGQKDFRFPNILRAFKGRLSGTGTQKEGGPAVGTTPKGALLAAPLEILEANIDDLNPEIYAYVLERLFSSGALDVYLTPIQMKKNRPAVKISVLANPQQAKKLGEILLQETTTLGYRRLSAEKIMLPRRQTLLKTPWGKVRIKIAGTAPDYQNISPEYADCLRIARTKGIPLKKVYRQIWKLLRP